MNIDDIKIKFTPLDINMGPGDDAYRDGIEIVERSNIVAIIKHPTENKFLVSKWKKVNWSGFVTGGIEDGNDAEKTAKEELIEETGYKNIRKIITTDFVSNSLFYHVVKNQNRLAHYNLVYIELEDLECDQISEQESAICDLLWIDEDDVMDNLSRNDMKSVWVYYQDNKANF